MLVTVGVRQEQQGASGCKRRELQRKETDKDKWEAKGGGYGLESSRVGAI